MLAQNIHNIYSRYGSMYSVSDTNNIAVTTALFSTYKKKTCPKYRIMSFSVFQEYVVGYL